ncbi:hypothetical protein DFH09DRAFT_1416437 [Mycena vulgaris]|nr:hypothetical protein DFH09DRAFT_1416437 [Mycena vulgaris]
MHRITGRVHSLLRPEFPSPVSSSSPSSGSSSCAASLHQEPALLPAEELDNSIFNLVGTVLPVEEDSDDDDHDAFGGDHHASDDDRDPLFLTLRHLPRLHTDSTTRSDPHLPYDRIAAPDADIMLQTPTDPAMSDEENCLIAGEDDDEPQATISCPVLRETTQTYPAEDLEDCDEYESPPRAHDPSPHVSDDDECIAHTLAIP